MYNIECHKLSQYMPHHAGVNGKHSIITGTISTITSCLPITCFRLDVI